MSNIPPIKPAEKPSGKPAGWFAKLLRSADTESQTSEDSQSAKRQRKMMSAAELFHHLRVEDLMVPRADIVSVERDIGLHDLSLAFEAAGHSRLPVYKETLDDPVGMVHVKDLMPMLMLNARGRNGKTYADKKVAPSILRPVLYVPPSMLAQELMQRMQARRMHMAIVVDEYGGTDGIVTLEDLVEAIVGNIEDEHDEVEAGIKLLTSPTGSVLWEADARTPIDDFELRLGRDFATVDQEEEVDTLGGLIFSLAGRIPERGEIIKHAGGVEFEVIDADARRIKRLRIRDVKKSARAARQPSSVPSTAKAVDKNPKQTATSTSKPSAKNAKSS